jgi:phosphohistidine swiveling domain-containing protein
MKTLKDLLKMHSLDIDPVEFLSFIKLAIELREKAKFFFTKNLSECLRLIKKIGSKNGFSSNELAFSNIIDIKDLTLSANSIKDTLRSSIKKGKNEFCDSSRMILPPLIKTPKDIWSFEWPKTEPNFITKKQVTADVIDYSNKNILEGKIVCIPNADPGFDWIFSYKIAGFITAWGGANSHMAIRAFELQLPAVIGAGEILYNNWSSSNTLFIDCFNRKVEIIL